MVTLILVTMNRKKRPDPQRIHDEDNRRSRDQRRIDELEEENRRLRREKTEGDKGA